MPKLTAITPVPFATKAWKRITDYFFAAQLNIIHVVAAELPHLVPTMPLGFVQAGSSFELVAVCSLQPNTSLYVAPDGRWLGNYIPAALRGYPFRLAKVEGREESILCIDEESGVVVDAGLGEAFFDESGTPAQAVQGILHFLTQVERSQLATQAAVEALRASGVIQRWPLNLQHGDQVAPVEGLFRIDEAALNELSDEGFLKLRSTGGLAVAYAQLLSMNQLAVLQRLEQMQMQLKAQAAAQINALSGLDSFNLFQDDATITFTY